MAVYKVAQDVEADDKLIGPFSFRQFIYLLIVAGSIGVAWGLSRIFIPLAIIPLPIIVFFGALALPLRKDQPMEIYMAALLSYHTKSRKRFWIPDGIESLVEITVPKVVEVQRTKTLSQAETERRLSYLASLADSGGWSIRNGTIPTGTPMISDVYNEAQQAEDILDDTNLVARNFNTMLDASDARRRQEVIDRMNSSAAGNQLPPGGMQTPVTSVYIPPPPDPYAVLSQKIASPAPADDSSTPQPQFNPYPTSIRQSVIQPLDPNHVLPDTGQPAASTPPQAQANDQNSSPPTSISTISPDIIGLANNHDLSIETIAREAHRIEKKKQLKLADDEEVVISLR